jgi:peptide/nickel transport system permease protein
MNLKMRIWHYLSLLWLSIIIFRFEVLLNGFYFLIKYVQFIFQDLQSALNILDFSQLDFMISLAFIIILPVIIALLLKKSKYLNLRISFAKSFILLLFFFFIFAPIITNENPDFQKDVNVTKLLPPFSKVKVIFLKDDYSNSLGKLKGLLELKRKVVKNSYDKSIIFIDSIGKQGNSIYQGKKVAKINMESVVKNNGTILVSKKLFVFGSDEYGRDLFTRIIYGTRISLLVGLCAVFFSLLVGLLFGFLSGYIGGVVDIFLSRITDIFLTFPIIFLILLILALFGNNLFAVIFVLGFTGWMTLFKVVKSEVISIKNKDFFITSRLLGLSNLQLLKREIIPLILAPLIVNIVFQFCNVIFAESALSYLGLGVGSNYPSWGAMIESGQEYLNKAWWMSFCPGLMLVLTLLSVDSFGREINRNYNAGIVDDKR